MRRILKNALLLAAVCSLLCACALGEIRLGRKGIEAAEGLNKDVTNILVLLQDGDTTDTLLIASINTKTGRSVMTQIDPSLPVTLEEVGEMTLGEAYAQGDRKSKGFVACRTVNRLLGLNVSTFVALDIGDLPKMVSAIGQLNMKLTKSEAAALGKDKGSNALTGDEVLAFVRLHLENDKPGRSRGYDTLMQLLYQGLHSGDLGGLMSLGNSLLSGLDTNLSALTGMTLVSAVQGGTDRRELALPGEDGAADSESLRAALYKEIYE